MEFFVNENKRKISGNTEYFEFQKGQYHDKCWLPDSISISAALWDKYNLSDLIGSVVKNFDYYGITTVTKEQWAEIVKISQESWTIQNKIIAEALPWVNECFKEYDVFTILGL